MPPDARRRARRGDFDHRRRFGPRRAARGGSTRLLSGATAAALAAFLFGAATGCTSRGSEVLIETPDARRIVVAVEIADTPEQRRRGLMWRTDLAPDQGMLFVFDEDARHDFWMKNTPTSLDLLFIRSDGEVVGIRERTVPFSTATVGIDHPSRLVLEVPAGFVERHAIEVGSQVTVSSGGRGSRP